MLESIKVTERLHWPEVDLPKKYIFNSAEKAVSLSQVCLEKIPSTGTNSFPVTGSVSYSILLKAEEEQRKSAKQAKRPKTSLNRVGKSNRPGGAHKRSCVPDGCRRPTPTNCVASGSSSSLLNPTHSFMVVSSTMKLSPHTDSQLRKVHTHNLHRTKPLCQKAAVTQKGKLCIFTAIKPSNIERERDKFFKSGFKHNPRFEYSNPVSPLVLEQHSTASDRFLAQALRIMELTLVKYGSYERFEQVTGGHLLSRSLILKNVKKYMEKEECVGEIMVKVTDDILSRASMTVVNSQPTLTINTSTARQHWLEGMLRHEIGTHYFRGVNNCQQPWSSSSGRKKFNLKPLNPTEEGLASIHSVLFRKDPTLWRAALLYYTVYQASRMSFSQLFHDLGHFIQDPNTRWDYCVRAKRGQTDTAQPGCFSKDQVYLDGVLMILRHRDKIDFTLLMALGKVSFKDVDRLKASAHTKNARIPHFMQDKTRYAEQLTKIMEVNQLTDEELRSII